MKFDVFKWKEVSPNEDHEAPQGRLHIMCSEIGKTYVSAQGVEVLAAVGHETDIQSKEALTFRVEAPDAARVFVEVGQSTFTRTQGEVFTNMDRTPTESGNVLEVRKAMRAFQLEQNALKRELILERRELQRMRKAGVETPPADPEPVETAEPVEEPEAEPEDT